MGKPAQRRPILVTTRNARFQEWSALLTNRTKRQRTGSFLIQGVRPLDLAVRAGWPLRTLLHTTAEPLSAWARDLLAATDTPRAALDPALLAELGQQDDGVPELLAVAAIPDDDLARIPARADLLLTVFDRPASPGNVGTLIRAVDALGGSGLATVGHAADVYDPKAVRASTGSLFCVPAVRAPSSAPVLDWVAAARRAGTPVTLVGLDEHGTEELAEVDLRGPTVLVVGSEKRGLSAGWRDGCDVLARIPIGGGARSLNAAAAGTVALYEAARQRRTR